MLQQTTLGGQHQVAAMASGSGCSFIGHQLQDKGKSVVQEEEEDQSLGQETLGEIILFVTPSPSWYTREGMGSYRRGDRTQ